jgi:hypothetical protein
MAQYNPARGGHAPGHLRDALRMCFESGRDRRPWYMRTGSSSWLNNFDLGTSPRPALDKEPVWGRAEWLCGQLWNCTDIVPWTLFGDVVEQAGLPTDARRTYGSLARYLRPRVKRPPTGGWPLLPPRAP